MESRDGSTLCCKLILGQGSADQWAFIHSFICVLVSYGTGYLQHVPKYPLYTYILNPSWHQGSREAEDTRDGKRLFGISLVNATFPLPNREAPWTFSERQ